MSNMTPKKRFIVIAFNIDQIFFEFLDLPGSSVYQLPDNGLQIETLTYSASIDLIIQPDLSLI